MTVPVLRVARPTDDLDALLPFYRDGLGLAVLYRCRDHDGFDGIMLGRAGAPHPLEFTSKRGHRVGRAPTEDNFAPVKPFNPYWDKDGATFEDPDGYRVVLQNAAWTV